MEGSKQLNLRWDDHCHTFVHLLNHFRLQGLYCDASLACAGGGGVYPVHKVVLSACSDFFASIFASASYQNPVVVLQDVAREHLEALLTYVYRGQVLLARPDLPAFLKVAESLQVKGLAPPPLIPLPCDTWGVSTGVLTPLDASQHAAMHRHPSLQKYTHPAPPPAYPGLPSSPLGRCGMPWEGEEVQRSAAPLHTPLRARGSSRGNGDSLRSPRKRFSPHFAASEHFGGTFQNLVASEEGGIKEEPLEEDTEFFETDTTLTICEREEEQMEEEEGMKEEEEEEVKERQIEEEERRPDDKQKDNQQRTQEEVMEEERRREEEERRRGGGEGGVNIMLDTRHPVTPPNTPAGTPTMSITSGPTHSPSHSLSTHSPTPSHPTHSPSPTLAQHAHSPTHPHALSPTPAHPAHTPVTATPPITTSQLRRELLKPVHSRNIPIPLSPHAIPHPVIATREGEGEGVMVGEEVGEGMEMPGIPPPPPPPPPPLVKISASGPVSSSNLHHYSHHHHHHHHQHHPHLGHHHLHHQNSELDNTTTTTTTRPPFPPVTPVTTTNTNTHHLLVTTQPTYRTRLPPPLTAVPPPPPPPSQHHITIPPYKTMHLIDTDTPLNLSQDTHHAHTHNTHHTYAHARHILHRHRNTGTSRLEQDKPTRDGDPFLGKILTNRKRRLRGPKSWEYLVRLLRDPSTNPSLIRWENEAKGVFRLAQPAVIARRWGRRTGKHASDNLTYENFARGLRYHYATGALEPVSERSFVYKFGPKALLALEDGGECGMPEEMTPV